jgi:DNA invertase Pin-like site-specific DNA recombinase
MAKRDFPFDDNLRQRAENASDSLDSGNVERPALQRLLADIEAGKIDCVVVYKVDRMSRSLLDFGRLMEVSTNSTLPW